MNEAILLTEGTKAIMAMIVNQVPLRFTKFRIGSTVSYTPRITDTDVRGYVYEGGADAMRWFLGENPEILVIELTLNSSIGDFNVGNIMAFDQNGKPFAAGVRTTPLPKIKTTTTQQGSELILQFAVRILSNEKASSLQVLVENSAAHPVVDTEDGLVGSPPGDAEFPLYVVQNFNGLNTPALLYADADNDTWWVNNMFQAYHEGYFTTLSGGRVGDKYSRPAGKLYFGGYFNKLDTSGGTLNGGTFGDNASSVSIGGGNFGD